MLTAGLSREEEGGRLLENREAGLTRLAGSEWAEAAAGGIGSSSSSLGDTSRSSSSPLPKEFSRFARLSLISGTFSLSTNGLDFELPSTSLESLLAVPALWSRWSLRPFTPLDWTLVDGLDLLFSLESLTSLRAGLALGLAGLGLAGLGLAGLGLAGLGLAGLVN